MMDHLLKQGTRALWLMLLGAGTMASVSCGDSLASQHGTILVEATTLGDGADPDGYTIRVNNARATAIEAQGTIYVENLEAGSYQVSLTGMAADCSTRPGRNPITVTVVPADTVNAAFEVTCDAPPGGGDPP
jgi:hypothetical protein